jgi:hypothetical protein
MATFNLVRNSRVVFTNNVDASTGVITTTGLTTSNAYELQVLDGFTFSQASNADTITISEAGSDPVRGQRSFNTSLNNVEFSFSTYMRPRLSTTVKAEEYVLWNALLGTNHVTASATSFTYTTLTSATLTGNRLALVGTGMATLTVGDYYVVKGVVGAGANEYNTAVKVITSTATLLEIDYIKSPESAELVANWGASGVVSFSVTAWNEHVTVAADLNAPYSEVTTAFSNKNQLEKFGMIFTVDGITYLVDNCAMDQASIDFGLDGIAMIAWTGKGTALRQIATVTYSSASDPVLSGGLTGTIKGKNTTANYITQKLATVTLKKNIGGIGAGNTEYTLALTGGNITIANNISYVTPANLGVVNIPIGYYTGTRAISGTLNAYLRTGSTNTAGLLDNMLTNASTSVDPKFFLEIQIGGAANATKIEVQVTGAMIQIPTIDAQAVMSTAINFTAQGTDAVQGATALYDIENVNDLRVRYFSAA